jgi:demethylphylloquinone reductase
MTRICILGGGFAGLYTALRLHQMDWGEVDHEIILVDKSDRFVFTPLLYELLTQEMATWEVAPTFLDLCQGTDIQFRQAVVQSIDLSRQEVQLLNNNDANQETTTLPYDRLVLAMGGETPLGGVPGVEQYGIPFRNLADVSRLEKRLRELENSDQDKIRVAIVGAGYSGVELACKLADRLGDRGRLRLIEMGDKILAPAPDFNRTAAQKALSQKEVWIDLETSVNEVTAQTISLKFKEQIDEIPVDIVLWTVGNKVSPAIAALELARNQRGQLKTLPTLQTIDKSTVYALGDLAEILDQKGKVVNATAQSAIQQADFAAWNIWADLTGRSLLPFKYKDLGEMMALGIDNATLTGLGIQLEGKFAYLARRLVYLYRQPTLEQQVQVGLSWISQPVAQLFKTMGG